MLLPWTQACDLSDRNGWLSVRIVSRNFHVVSQSLVLGFKINPYDECVANKMVDGKQFIYIGIDSSYPTGWANLYSRHHTADLCHSIIA